LRAAGLDVHVADLGGGLGIPHNPALADPPSPDDYGAMVRRTASGWGARLVFEPGRLIVGNAGILLSRVIRVKPGISQPFLIVDAAMNDLMRPALYDAWHKIEAVAPRGGTMIGKIRVSSVEPATAIGDIITTSLPRGVQVQPGDIVIYAGNNS